MTFVTLVNMIMILLSAAVILQTMRMARNMREIRGSALNDSVARLEHAADQAKLVLGQMKSLLATEVVAQGRAVAASEALRDELSVMVGIGNAVAERILEAAAMQKDATRVDATKKAGGDRRQGARKTRSRTAAGRRKSSSASALADVPVAGHA
ncbi:hypothetical protein [Sphingobium sp.]|uniref:hypothetical protein n=1 Tax=Sphingobium sp. TaxID=1912891 RepID=UPI0035C74F53